MKLEIKGKEHDVFFNIRFVNNLNKKFVMKQHGLEVGVGLQSIIPKLELHDVTALVDVVHAGAYPVVTEKEAEEALEAYGKKHGDYEELFDKVGKQLLKAPATKAVVKQMQGEAEKN